jgi:O-antigen/teichoic acid export membrane protein
MAGLGAEAPGEAPQVVVAPRPLSDPAPQKSALSGVGGRAGWGFLDQVLSSVSNFALSAFAAASLSAVEFGSFTIAYAVYGVCIGISAGLASIPLVVRHSATEAKRFSSAARLSTGTALAAGTISGVACVLVAPFTSSSLDGLLVALGVTLPGLLLQDAWRHSFVAGKQSRRAAANDGLWLALQALAIGGCIATDSVSATTLVLAWGGAATAAAIFGIWQSGTVPAPHKTHQWLSEQRELGFRYAVEAMLHRSGAWIALALVGAVSGLAVLGALRGAFLLVTGPLNLLFVGATFVLVPEGVRLLGRSTERFRWAVRRLSICVTALAAGWSLVVLALPDAIGSRLLGATWPGAESLLPLLALFAIALGTSMGPAQGMLALGAARRSMFTQAVAFAISLPAVVAGAAAAGAKGAAAAMVATAVLRSVLAWVQYGRAFRDAVPPAPIQAIESQEPELLSVRHPGPG